MKKTLIALSLAALPVAASADVTLYGTIKSGVEVSRHKTVITENGKTEKKKTTTPTKSAITDLGSYIGFKGHEHLGDNLNVIWQVQNKASIAGEGGVWASSQSFIGLEGGFGTVRVGKISTQLSNMGKLDNWEYNNPALGLAQYGRTGERLVSVRYDSPVVAGFSGNVQFVPRDNGTSVRRKQTFGDNKTVAPDAISGREVGSKVGDTSRYYAGLNYENAGFWAQYGFGYKRVASIDVQNKGNSGQVHRIEGGYDNDALFVGLGYQYGNGWDSLDSYNSTWSTAEYKANGDESPQLKTHEAAVTVGYRFGNVSPRLSYVHGWQAKDKAVTTDEKYKRDLAATKYDQVVVGADYDFSKRTSALVSAGWVKAGSSKNRNEYAAGLVGLRHRF